MSDSFDYYAPSPVVSHPLEEELHIARPIILIEAELHRILSKVIFEARKAVEYRFANQKKLRKK